MLGATIFSVSIFAVLGVPIILGLLLKGVKLLNAGFQGNIALLGEGLVLTSLMGAQIVGFIYFLVPGVGCFRSDLKHSVHK